MGKAADPLHGLTAREPRVRAATIEQYTDLAVNIPPVPGAFDIALNACDVALRGDPSKDTQRDPSPTVRRVSASSLQRLASIDPRDRIARILEVSAHDPDTEVQIATVKAQGAWLQRYADPPATPPPPPQPPTFPRALLAAAVVFTAMAVAVLLEVERGSPSFPETRLLSVGVDAGAINRAPVASGSFSMNITAITRR